MGRLEAARAKHAWVDHAVRTEMRFRQERVRNCAVVATYRTLFLSIVLMVVLLYVMGLITHVLPGTNEIVIPVFSVPNDQDLGAIVSENFAHSSGAVINLVGVLTLGLSAMFTSKALREGSGIILRPEREKIVRLLDFKNLLLGALIAAVVLLSWLMVLATSIRRSAYAELIGVSSPGMVNFSKAITIIGAWLMVSAVAFVAVRAVAPTFRAKAVLLPATVFAAFVVVANFVLIYAYVAALVDPDTSGSVVLVLTILTWVNVVVRGWFYVQCWISVAASDDFLTKDPARDLHSRG